MKDADLADESPDITDTAAKIGARLMEIKRSIGI
jgi:hypothetical protein